MQEKYIPPFDTTTKMIEIAGSIFEKLGQLTNVNNLERLPQLRKVNRIKSIQSSLAIENNSLTIGQVTSLINGRRVLGPIEDIRAVHNANLAYKELENINPYNLSDLLKIHGIMMNGLVHNPGKLRTSQVGVYDELGNAVHIAPSSSLVPSLISSLFDWVKSSDTIMLIKSSVFHYEFEFIHPFEDGNGRMGRLWQTALLTSWRPIFAYLPIESVIKDNQEKYYEAIASSTKEGKSNNFIIFMLEVIDKAISDLILDTKNHLNHLNNQILRLVEVMDSYPLSTKELMDKLNLKSREGFRRNYLEPALEAGLIDMTIPDKPTSKNQKYYKK